MSSGWIGPGARGSPQNQEDNVSYGAVEVQVEKDEKVKREAENTRRASEGLSPCKCRVRVDVGVGRMLMGGGFAVKDGVWSKAKKVVQKALMM